MSATGSPAPSSPDHRASPHRRGLARRRPDRRHAVRRRCRPRSPTRIRPLNPPNCSAADLEGVRAGVDAATSAYLFTHPDFNWFVTSLEGLPADQVSAQDDGLPERSTRRPRTT